MVLAYRGLDKVVRRTNVKFSPAPERLNATAAWYDVQLAAGEERTYTIAVECWRTKASSRSPSIRQLPNRGKPRSRLARGTPRFGPAIRSSMAGSRVPPPIYT